jgi:hypothetical protein
MSNQVKIGFSLLLPAFECLKSTERPYTLVLESLPRDDTACTAPVSFETSLRRDEDGIGEVIRDGAGRCGVVRCLVHAKSCIALVRMSGELLSCTRRGWSTDGFSRVRVWVTSRRWAALCSFGADVTIAAPSCTLTARVSSRSRCTIPDADADAPSCNRLCSLFGECIAVRADVNGKLGALLTVTSAVMR